MEIGVVEGGVEVKKEFGECYEDMKRRNMEEVRGDGGEVRTTMEVSYLHGMHATMGCGRKLADANSWSLGGVPGDWVS